MPIVTPGAAELSIFVGAALALLLIPGRRFLFIVGRSVEQGRVAGLFSLLGIHAVALGLVTDGAYALAAGSAGNWLKRRRGFLQVERYATGALLVGLGVTAALAGNQRK